MKESVFIKWLDPILYKQKKTLKIMLCLRKYFNYQITLFHFLSHLFKKISDIVVKLISTTAILYINN